MLKSHLWCLEEVGHFDDILVATTLEHFDFRFDHKIMFLGCLRFVDHLGCELNPRRDVDDIVHRGERTRAEDFIDFVSGGKCVRK